MIRLPESDGLHLTPFQHKQINFHQELTMSKKNNYVELLLMQIIFATWIGCVKLVDYITLHVFSLHIINFSHWL